MATLTVQDVDLSGLNTHTWVDAGAAGDVFDNPGGNVLVKLRHVGAGTDPHVVTVDSQRQCDQGFDHDVTIPIDFGEEITAGPFGRLRFNTTGSQVSLSYDGVTDLEVAVLRLTAV